MVESSKDIPDDCGYNKIYRYQWDCSPKFGLNYNSATELVNICKKRFGWHFVPHKGMDYSRDNWYEDQHLIITFESKWDMIHAKLRINP